MSLDAVPAPEKQRGIPWKPGQSGNPKGREKGNRNKLSEDFIGDFHEAWKEYGPDALVQMATEDASGFVKAAVALMPKEFKLDVNDGRTEQQIESRVRLLAEQLGLALDLAAGNGPRVIGPEASEGSNQALALQSV